VAFLDADYDVRVGFLPRVAEAQDIFEKFTFFVVCAFGEWIIFSLEVQRIAFGPLK
jgi:hypothetical protein